MMHRNKAPSSQAAANAVRAILFRIAKHKSTKCGDCRYGTTCPKLEAMEVEMRRFADSAKRDAA